MQEHTGRYTIENYGLMEPFCSFLPGIGGEKGVPMWCYYVNRGQCVSSFGIEDKDHAIMEFFPAHQAYQYTSRVGWRTFLRMGDRFTEPFADADVPHAMHIGMNDLAITTQVDSVQVDVSYFTLPEERAAALVRKVTLTNLTASPLSIDMLDGMPALLPFGLNLHSVKHMTQTAKAWLQAEETDGDITFYRTRASMEDTSDVQQVLGVNFSTALTEKGEHLPVFVDPRHIFAHDSALEKPRGFLKAAYADWAAMPEVTQNLIPCCFYGRQLLLAPGESASHTIVVGQAESKERARAACAALTWDMLEKKALRADEMAWQLTDAIHVKTADPIFDMYSRQTYLDNLLRGGTPVTLPGGKVVYLFSRKHGDPERDYNAFRMRPEYYSQGNGNFRDVNQNRRCDVLFSPQVAQRNIRMFYSLLQLDGYNPLVVEFVQYTLDDSAREKLLAQVADASRPAAARLLSGAFTPGQLRMAVEDWDLACTEEDFFAQAISMSKEGVAATFSEGYWSDHWTYNLDQIEAYGSVYPEEEEALLYQDESYTWFLSPETLLPRAKRYSVTPRGVRQYAFLEKRAVDGSLQKDDQGQVLHATLMEKLLTLLAAKTATLDPYGMGVEMEGGKPGWYDALNGLPGLLGSSMPETLELARVLAYTLRRVKKYGRPVSLLKEAAALARGITAALQQQQAVWQAEGEILPVWNALCDLKEAYRAQVREAVSGEKTELQADELAAMLETWLSYVTRGVEKAMAVGGGLCPTYFAYDVTAYTQDESGLHPTAFAQRPMPNFLEGQVRYLRLDLSLAEKQRLVDAVRRSRLYDQKLHMYKVNAALGEASYEIGRAHAFTPGWLENESVWLHMEYKYLLELLRAGLYEDFIADFHAAAVPFLDPAMYGRSPFENSSFIASSANPDPAIHGKGFVARLSGSTAEFLSIWQIMMLGETLFTAADGRLSLTLQPLLPAYLTQGCETIEATLLGKTRVVYHIQPGKQYVPGQYALADALVTWQDGTQATFADGCITGEAAQRIRRQEAKEIHISLK